ncbi:MAG: hypothetical protein FJ145_10110 [Deltaproteobacteria bacterium]|nr:hypothetical protein [Deltaproteobacteria bacterium]
MELQKLAVKIFTEKPNSIPLTDFIDVFHSWIQATDGVYHDVADYSHMAAGPGVVLVANGANVGIDETDNRRGLLFTQKAPVRGSSGEVVKAALRAALESCRKLESDARLKGELSFSGREIKIAVNDRLLGPNTEAAFAELKPEVEGLAHALFAGAAFTVQRDTDPRKRLNVTLQAQQPFDAAALLANLART